MKPVIALTVGEIVNHHGLAWTPVAYGQFHTYTDAVVRAGGAPFLVPIVGDKAALRRLYDQCGGLLLSGGNDLNPDVYEADQSPRTISASPARDKQEIQLLKWALEDDKPVLGICRGMQLINVTLGGSLHQDISTDLPGSHNHTTSIDKASFHHVAHRLKVEPGSRLAEALGTDRLDANTLHHQAVDRLGDGLIATAYAEDGVVEAIELPGKRFVVGVQSHPEALEDHIEPLWRKLFIEFVDSSRTADNRTKAS